MLIGRITDTKTMFPWIPKHHNKAANPHNTNIPGTDVNAFNGADKIAMNPEQIPIAPPVLVEIITSNAYKGINANAKGRIAENPFTNDGGQTSGILILTLWS